MTARTFIDTNDWVCAVDTADPVKRAWAVAGLRATPETDYVISGQVVVEFFVTVTGKLGPAVPASDARATVQHMSLMPVVPIDLALVNDAITGRREWRLSTGMR